MSLAFLESELVLVRRRRLVCSDEGGKSAIHSIVDAVKRDVQAVFLLLRAFPSMACSITIEVGSIMVECQGSIISCICVLKVYCKCFEALFIVLHEEREPDGEWHRPRAGIR